MSNDIALPTPPRVGQGTAVEQARAVGEVRFRVELARLYPRDVETAFDEMREACRSLGLAERAFYSLPKGGDGGPATGSTIHLARELARIWGNIDYGVKHLLLDEGHGQSELDAFAWDLERNVRSSATFIQPHRRDLKGGRSKTLTTVQEIYESNTAAGSRRVREAIFAVLPRAFVDEATALCRATLERGDGETIETRRAKALTAFDNTFGVTEEQLARRVGRAPSRWDEQDVADLLILFRSLQRRETTVEQEFPAVDAVVTPAQIAEASRAAADDNAAAAEEQDGETR